MTTGPATILEVIAELEADGFTGQFGARPGGRIMCFTCRQAHIRLS